MDNPQQVPECIIYVLARSLDDLPLLERDVYGEDDEFDEFEVWT
jgi:hypothetical protein